MFVKHVVGRLACHKIVHWDPLRCTETIYLLGDNLVCPLTMSSTSGRLISDPELITLV